MAQNYNHSEWPALLKKLIFVPVLDHDSKGLESLRSLGKDACGVN